MHDTNFGSKGNLNRMFGTLHWLLIVGIFGGVVCLWVFLGNEPYRQAGSPGLDELGKAGTYGDSFGAVNALFSGLAFAGVIVALYLQTTELRLQREEMEEARRVWQDSADAQAEAQQSLKAQSETMIVAAYLNALSGLLDAPFASDMLRHDAVVRIRQMLPALENRVEFVQPTLQDINVELWAIHNSLSGTLHSTRDNTLTSTSEEQAKTLRVAVSEAIERLGRLPWSISDANLTARFTTILKDLKKLDGSELPTEGKVDLLRETERRYRNLARDVAGGLGQLAFDVAALIE